MHDARRMKLLAWALLSACSTSDDPAAEAPRPLDASLGAHDGSVASPLDASRQLDAQAASSPSDRDAQLLACDLPADCLPVRSPVFSLEPCCSESRGCGFDYASDGGIPRESLFPALGVAKDARCIPREKLFSSGPTGESQRVALDDGGQVLVSSACPTAFITSLAFRGCCLPSNECAVTTYAIHAELKVLAGGADAPFTQIECVKSEQLNAQLRSSSLAGLASLPSTTGSCDYAALDAMLARPAP